MAKSFHEDGYLYLGGDDLLGGGRMRVRRPRADHIGGLMIQDEGPAHRDPPKPPEPTAADIQAYHADTATPKAWWYGIPLPNLDSVKVAIQALADGRYRGAEAEMLAQMPDLTAVHYELAKLLAKPDRFVQRIFDALDVTFGSDAPVSSNPAKRPRYLKTHFARDPEDRYVDRARYYEEGWDYDGSGAFFKGHLSVQRLKAGGFELHHYQGGTGNAIEIKLARKLGVRMHFGYCTFIRSWIAEGQDIAIPASFFAEVLPVLGSSADPAEFAAAFVAHQNARLTGPSSEEPRGFEIPGTSFRARAEIECHNLRSRWERRSEPAVALKDGIITGPAKIHPNGRPYAASIKLSFSPREPSVATEDACVATLERLTALYPDLKPAH